MDCYTFVFKIGGEKCVDLIKMYLVLSFIIDIFLHSFQFVTYLNVSFFLVTKVYSLQLTSLWKSNSRMTVTFLMLYVAKKISRIFLGQKLSYILQT